MFERYTVQSFVKPDGRPAFRLYDELHDSPTRTVRRSAREAQVTADHLNADYRRMSYAAEDGRQLAAGRL